MNKTHCLAAALLLLALVNPYALGADEKLTEAANDPAFHKALLKAAAEYKNYGEVDENFQVAPFLCAAPSITSRTNSSPKISVSGDSSTHGQKIYRLYAKNKLAYKRLDDPESANTIVKESWVPKKELSSVGAHLSPDKLYALFIMTKLDSSTPGTDKGWVYGTVSADGKTVTSSGRVQSCMGCHQDAPYGRLFGLKN